MKIEERLSGWSIRELPKELEEAAAELDEMLPALDLWYGIDYKYKLVIAYSPKFRELREQLGEYFGASGDDPLPWLNLYLRFNH